MMFSAAAHHYLVDPLTGFLNMFAAVLAKAGRATNPFPALPLNNWRMIA